MSRRWQPIGRVGTVLAAFALLVAQVEAQEEEGGLPEVLVVLFGLLGVYVAMTPLFGNHVLLYGALFLFLFTIVQTFTPPYLVQQIFIGDAAGSKQ